MSARQPTVSALITCEHASNAVPERWRELFAGQQALLDSHRGLDIGSLELARALALRLDAPLLAGQVTRLLVDLNRSLHHPRHFSEFTRSLPARDRERLDAEYWWPHWQRYRRYLQELPGMIVHIACHSFTPQMHGKRRTCDVGLLYDPKRPRERAWCRALGQALREIRPDWAVRMNYPYRGTSNGMGQQHRPDYDDRRLITMELEMNQGWCERDDWIDRVATLARAVEHSLQETEKWANVS